MISPDRWIPILVQPNTDIKQHDLQEPLLLPQYVHPPTGIVVETSTDQSKEVKFYAQHWRQEGTQNEEG